MYPNPPDLCPTRQPSTAPAPACVPVVPGLAQCQWCPVPCSLLVSCRRALLEGAQVLIRPSDSTSSSTGIMILIRTPRTPPAGVYTGCGLKDLRTSLVHVLEVLLLVQRLLIMTRALSLSFVEKQFIKFRLLAI